jgi:hypothetical protein
MIFGLLRVLGPPQFKGAVPASEVKPTTGKGVAWVIIITSVIAVVFMMAHGLNNGLLTACIIGFSALVLGSIFFRGVSGSQGNRARLREMPGVPSPEMTAYRTQQMRARAGSLSTTTVLDKPAEATAAPAPARPVPQRTVVMTYRQMLDDRELTERMTRVAGIMITACPVCSAGGADACAFTPGITVYLLDRDRGLVAHGARIGRAVKAGTAKITDVMAQFKGSVPDDVWKEALL